MESKVSIVVPVYNAEGTIENCLNSLLLQTYSNKEIIVVDDGSTDNTADTCDRFQKSTNFIKVIHQSNLGVSAARNTAIANSTGEYIIFVDGDDTVDSKYIEELMEWAEYDFVTAGYYWQKPDLSWNLRKFEDISISKRDLETYPSKFMGKYYFGSPWATLMKREIINSARLKFDETIHCGEDILFIFQYLRHVNSIKVLPTCGYRYFYYCNSLVNKKHDDFWKWKIRVENEIFNFFKPHNQEEYIALLNRKFYVLRDLLRDYSNQMSNQELFDLYQQPFFEDGIKYITSNGKFKDRVLIFAMEHKNYKIYVMYDKLCSLFKRIKNKIRRTFTIYAR